MSCRQDTDSGPALVHQPVLLDESVNALIGDAGGRYIDGTFGRGGHSRRILQQLDKRGRLLAFDKDPEAIRAARLLAEEDSRFSWYHGSFAEVTRAMAQVGWETVNGVLLDLGVSSPQLDDPARGFSFLRDGPLDMRMDPERSPSAAEWLATASEQEIADVIWRYGEERFSRRIARLLVERRREAPLRSTRQLAELVAEAVPRKERNKHPATRTFQAIRIFINRELEDLEICLRDCTERLAPGGRLVVISFHSLEDRLVKRFMREQVQGPKIPRGVPVTAAQEQTQFRLVGKARRAGDVERDRNIRARSAVMRVLERIERKD